MQTTLQFTLFLVLFSFVVSETCFGISSTSLNVCSSKGLCVSKDLCSCYSGFGGSQCEIQAPSTCQWNIVSQSKVDYFPTMDISSLSLLNDHLEFTIKAPLVRERYNRTVYVENLSYSNCKYPGKNAENILDVSNPCYNKFHLRIPIEEAKECGWRQEKLSNGKTLYSGNIYVDEQESIGSLRGYPLKRTMNRVIPLRFEL